MVEYRESKTSEYIYMFSHLIFDLASKTEFRVWQPCHLILISLICRQSAEMKLEDSGNEIRTCTRPTKPNSSSYVRRCVFSESVLDKKNLAVSEM